MAGRWNVLAVGLLVECIGGMFYAFSVYSPDLKAHFNMTQYELDLYASGANWGGNFGVHFGYLYDYAGPSVVIACAGCLGGAGWLTLFFLWLSGAMPPYAVLLAISIVQGHGQAACMV